MSFGGIKGMQLGQFIALSLAVHNIPEGLAVGLVLTTRKVSKVRAGESPPSSRLRARVHVPIFLVCTAWC